MGREQWAPRPNRASRRRNHDGYPAVDLSAGLPDGRGTDFISSNFVRGNVQDETGLDGLYNFDLMWNEAEGPSVFRAVQKPGLRLEARNVPVSYFTIDSAARPGDNQVEG